jgi:REP element-mobilizing transposase RayT
MDIDRIEVSTDHVHVLAKVVGMVKSVSASIIFERYPNIKKELKLWRSNF